MTTSKSEKKKDNKKVSNNAESFKNLETTLAQAQAAIQSSQEGIARLHFQWRSHLQRLGYLMIFITLYQIYVPAKSCYTEMTIWNHHHHHQRQLGGELTEMQIVLIVLSDSIVCILALMVALLLVSFMHSSQNRTLSNPMYLLSSSFVPVILALWYLQNQLQQQQQQEAVTNEAVPNCLATNFLFRSDHTMLSSFHSTIQQEGEENGMKRKRKILRDLPVVLVFHVLVSICYFFMSHQRAKQTRNLEAIVKLRDELQASKKKR